MEDLARRWVTVLLFNDPYYRPQRVLRVLESLDTAIDYTTEFGNKFYKNWKDINVFARLIKNCGLVVSLLS